jgi:hypothetical protein
MIEIPEHRVVLQQVRKRFGVGQIVDGHKVDVRITNRSAKNITSDATESIDTNLHRHVLNPPKLNEFVSIVGQDRLQIWDRIPPGVRRRCNLERPRSVSTQRKGRLCGAFQRVKPAIWQLFETAFPNAT